METISTYEQQAIDFLTATNTEFKTEFLRFAPHFNDKDQNRNIFKITLSKDGKSYSFEFGQSLVNSCKETPKLFTNKNEDVEIYGGVSYRNYAVSMNATIKTNIHTLKEIHEGKKDIQSLFNIEFLQSRVNKALDDVKKYNSEYKNRYYKLENTYAIRLEKLIEVLTESANSKINELLNEKVFEEPSEGEKVAPTAYDVLACLTKYDVGTFENFCADFGYDEDSRKAKKTYKTVCEEYKNISSLYSESDLEQLQEIQ